MLSTEKGLLRTTSVFTTAKPTTEEKVTSQLPTVKTTVQTTTIQKNIVETTIDEDTTTKSTTTQSRITTAHVTFPPPPTYLSSSHVGMNTRGQNSGGPALLSQSPEGFTQTEMGTTFTSVYIGRYLVCTKKFE